MTKWDVIPFDESFVDSTTEALTLRDISNNDRVRFSTPTLGKSVVPVHKITDIPLVNGFRQFEHDKVYLFVEEISSSDTLLIPAGWNGYIVGMHNPLTKYDYTGTGLALQTLNIDGSILLIADAGGGAITVTTTAPHGLLDGQFVNMVTGLYNQQKLVVSNVTASTFDVQLAFLGSQVGTFDTGYDTVNIMNMAFTNAGTGSGINVTAATTSSIFRYYNMKINGFTNPLVIQKGTIIGYDGDIDTSDNAVKFLDIDKATISTTTIARTALGSERTALILEGSLTRDITLDKMQFNVGLIAEFPIKIDSATITNANISITNSLDNNVAPDFFEPVGGLDQTDPQVFTFNNGLRANSKNIASIKVVGNATSFNPGTSFGSFNFGFSAAIGTLMEGWERVSSATGRVRYIGLRPFTGVATVHMGFDAQSGKDYNFAIQKNLSTLPEQTGLITISQMTPIGYTAEITAVTNDEFEPQVLVDVAGDTVTANDMSFIIEET